MFDQYHFDQVIKKKARIPGYKNQINGRKLIMLFIARPNNFRPQLSLSELTHFFYMTVLLLFLLFSSKLSPIFLFLCFVFEIIFS